MKTFYDEPELAWLIIDASHIKVHPRGTGVKGGNQEMGCTKGSSTRKLHLAVDAHGKPVRARLTIETIADCVVAERSYILVSCWQIKVMISMKFHNIPECVALQL